MIEQQIDIKIVAVNRDPCLPGDKRKTNAEFE